MRRNENWNDRDFRHSDFDRADGPDWRHRNALHEENPEAIEADIRRTRAEMDETIDELIRRLEPGRILNDVWRSVRSRAGSAGDGAAHLAGRAATVAGSSVARQVVRHPLPSALIGAGLAWLITEQARGGSRGRDRYDSGDWDADDRYRGGPMSRGPYARSEERLRGYSGYNPYEHEEHERRGGMMRGAAGIGGRITGAARGAASSVGDVAGRAGHTVTGAGRRALSAAEEAAERGMHSVSDAAQRIGDRASTGVHTAGRRISRTANHAADNISHTASETWERYPLGVALGAVGVGLLAGMAIPNTRRENRLMGETSRRLRRDAIGTAREQAAGVVEAGAERVAHAAESMAERAERAVRGSDGQDHHGRGEGSSGGAGSQRDVATSGSYSQEHRESGEGRHPSSQSGPSGQSGSQIEPRH